MGQTSSMKNKEYIWDHLFTGKKKKTRKHKIIKELEDKGYTIERHCDGWWVKGEDPFEDSDYERLKDIPILPTQNNITK